MSFSKRQTRMLVVVGVVVGAVMAQPVLAAVLQNSATVSGTIPLNAGSGPQVDVQNADELNLTDFADANSIRVRSKQGNVTLSSSTPTEADVAVDQINTPWTRVTQIDATTANLSITPSGKNTTTVGGGVDIVKVRDPVVDDGEADAVVTGSGTGLLDFETTNAVPGELYALVDTDTNAALDVGTADADQSIAFTEVPLSTHTVEIKSVGNMTIRRESPPYDVIDDRQIEVIFYEDSTEGPIIENFTTTDGKIRELEGLPLDEQFAVQIDTGGYHNRTVLFNDISQQKNAYLLNTSKTNVTNVFTVNDLTGKFPSKDTELVIQRAINQSSYGTGGYEWKNIAGDDLGADEAFAANLELDERYRLAVRNDNGDMRVLGAYTPKTAGKIELDIGSVSIEPEGGETVQYGSKRVNNSGQVSVQFAYNDTSNRTTTLWVQIHEYNNESNVLLQNTSFAGPFGNFSLSQQVPANQNDVEWVVDFHAERDGGDDIDANSIVSGRKNVLPGLSPWIVTAMFSGTMLIVAGLFSQTNGDIGGLVVAGLGSVFWFLGLAPDYLGAGVVVLSMMTAGILFLRERRAGGL